MLHVYKTSVLNEVRIDLFYVKLTHVKLTHHPYSFSINCCNACNISLFTLIYISRLGFLKRALIFQVRREGHKYLQEAEVREEGGPPAIVEAVRAGLVFQLKEAVTHKAIMQREEELCW